MTTEHVTSRSRGAFAPEVFLQSCRPQRRGRRECRVPAGTRGLVCNVHRQVRTRAYRYSRSSPAFPAHGFTAYTALSPETNSFCLRRRRIEDLAKPGWDSQHLRRLDASNGRQDHTALPSASAPFVGARPSLMSKLTLRRLVARPALPRPPLPAPYVRDDRDTPLLWARDGGSCRVDLGLSAKRNIFRARAGQVLSDLPVGQSHSDITQRCARMRRRSSFSPCGRRWREAPDEGFSPRRQTPHAETDPSSVSPPLSRRRSTFSHKGRREAARAPRNEDRRRHFVGWANAKRAPP